MNNQLIRILLIEDNPGDAFLIEEQLKRADIIDFNLINVDYLHKAIATLKQDYFDIILLDLILPDSKGMETFVTIKEINPNIPIILLTGMNDRELAIEAVRQGAQDYLSKNNLSGETIVKAIRYAIERKHNLAKLEQTILELEGFNYMVSHDLRTPLTVIKGMSSHLLDKYSEHPSVDKDYKKIEFIYKSCLRMDQLIDNLLMLSQVQHSEIKIQLVNMTDIVQQIVSELQQKQSQREVNSIVQSQVMAQGDPRLLRIALENLLGNSWKYTKETEKPRIEFGSFLLAPENIKLKNRQIENLITNKKLITSDRTVYFVSDNGVGFDPQQADRLFTPFQRLHNKNQFQGTGIGLAIVKRIIDRHGGQIWFDAKVDRGATFYFILSNSENNWIPLN